MIIDLSSLRPMLPITVKPIALADYQVLIGSSLYFDSYTSKQTF